MQETLDKNPPPSGSLTSTVARVGHSEQVLDWRLDRFKRMGYSLNRAMFLADTNIDIHTAEKYKQQGCSLALIEEILLGTDFAGDDARWYNPPLMIEAEVEEMVEDVA